jgi:hypothetical protein
VCVRVLRTTSEAAAAPSYMGCIMFAFRPKQRRTYGDDGHFFHTACSRARERGGSITKRAYGTGKRVAR